MGRPLAKRYFGNLNTNDTGDNASTYSRSSHEGIGGQGVASYGTIVAGSGWTTIPTVSFSGPTLPGGQSVAGTVHYKALSFATTANGSGYNVGDVVEVHTGTATTKARATVAAITVVTATKHLNTGTGYADGDTITFSSGWSTPCVLRVNRPGGGTGSADNYTIVNPGVRSSAAPTNPVSPDSHTGSGSGATVDFVFGAYSFSAPTVAGDYTTFPSTNSAGVLDSISPATGTGAKADITMGLLSITVTDPGSGYLNAADAAVSFSGSTGAAATAVLTTDDGTPYDAEAFPAIIAYAKTTSGGTNQIADINRQRGSHRYYVTTADGSAVCQLKTTGAASSAGEMTIKATDSAGKTYYVQKLTAHRATLVPYGSSGWNFPLVNSQPQSVHWTFSTGDATYNSATSVVIENA